MNLNCKLSVVRFKSFFNFTPASQLGPLHRRLQPCCLFLRNVPFSIFGMEQMDWSIKKKHEFCFVSITKQHGMRADTMVRCFWERNRPLPECNKGKTQGLLLIKLHKTTTSFSSLILFISSKHFLCI